MKKKTAWAIKEKTKRIYLGHQRMGPNPLGIHDSWFWLVSSRIHLWPCMVDMSNELWPTGSHYWNRTTMGALPSVASNSVRKANCARMFLVGSCMVRQTTMPSPTLMVSDMRLHRPGASPKPGDQLPTIWGGKSGPRSGMYPYKNSPKMCGPWLWLATRISTNLILLWPG